VFDEKDARDLGPMKWSTPAPIFKWGLCVVGTIMIVLGLLGLWNLETSGTVFVRGSGRIPVGNFVWGYRFVLAVFLAMAAGLASAWYWFPKISVFEKGLVLPCGSCLLWSDDFECQQVSPGKWIFQKGSRRIEMVVYDAPSI